MIREIRADLFGLFEEKVVVEFWRLDYKRQLGKMRSKLMKEINY